MMQHKETEAIHHYGTLNVRGLRAYKVSPNEVDELREKGYRCVGRGNTYVYMTRGEPASYQDPSDAVVWADSYSMSPENCNGNSYWRIRMYKGGHVIYSGLHAVPDTRQVEAFFEKRGLRRVDG